MSIGYVLGQNRSDGKADIIGIVKQAKAKGIVNAGDFVNFIKDYSNPNNISPDTQLGNMANYSDSGDISATALNENKVFVIINEMYNTYGVVCTVDENSISVGALTILSTGNTSSVRKGTGVAAITINENKVCAFYVSIPKNGSSYICFYTFCTISGTSIAVGTPTTAQIVETNKFNISAIKLSENRILLCGGEKAITVRIFTIGDTSLTMLAYGSNTFFSSVNAKITSMSAIELSGNRIFFTVSKEKTLEAVVATINGNTIVPGTIKTILSNSSTSISGISLAVLNDKVFLVYNQSYLHALMCTINGTTITPRNRYSINFNS